MVRITKYQSRRHYIVTHSGLIKYTHKEHWVGAQTPRVIHFNDRTLMPRFSETAA